MKAWFGKTDVMHVFHILMAEAIAGGVLRVLELVSVRYILYGALTISVLAILVLLWRRSIDRAVTRAKTEERQAAAEREKQAVTDARTAEREAATEREVKAVAKVRTEEREAADEREEEAVAKARAEEREAAVRREDQLKKWAEAREKELQDEVARLERQHLDALQKHEQRLNQEFLKKLAEMRDAEERKFVARTDEHHKFVHIARDLAIHIIRMRLSKARHPKAQYSALVPRDLLRHIRKMLDHLASCFKLLVPPGTNVYAAIREAIDDEFVTICRGGLSAEEDEARQEHTKPLHYQTRIVVELNTNFYEKQLCVTLTGSDEKTWHPLPNDTLGKDRSVLLGAGFEKALNGGNGKLQPVRLRWIVGVAADTPGAFTEAHRSLMKCFLDVFTLILHLLLDLQSGEGFNTVQFPNPGKPKSQGAPSANAGARRSAAPPAAAALLPSTLSDDEQADRVA